MTISNSDSDANHKARKRNETKRNETKRNETKRKQNKSRKRKVAAIAPPVARASIVKSIVEKVSPNHHPPTRVTVHNRAFFEF